ncbi:MAG TPA: iron-sulfur cluster assembly accessory protein [Candidatus Nitrosotenuis sp.]|jgi:iron-sulfur cluster assembly protein|nr:iron-sulfur cluster assembly accessory protein [Candidatus Nitrosotenuis sp.]
MITLTETALKEVKRLMQEHNLQDAVLRMGVQGGGCSGLSYTLGFDKEVSETDNIFEHDGVKVVVDMKSYLYLEGTELDYTYDMLGGGFKFNNPNASRSCGCGSSFAP